MGSTNKDGAFIRIKKQHIALVFVILLIVVGLVACRLLSGGDDTPTPTPIEVVEELLTEIPTPTEEPAPTGPPEAPTNLTAVLSGAREVTLSWTDTSMFEEGFIVVRALAETDDPGVELGRPAQDATDFVDGSVECSRKYRYLVSAFNSLGVSEAVCIQVELPENCEDDTQPLVVTECEAPDEMETPTPMAGGESGEGGEGGSGAAPVCGDGICNGTETNSTCSSDCAECNNNGICDAGEDALTCPLDCAMAWVCNFNGICDLTETVETCPSDCAPPTCGNGTCDGDEDECNCPDDCPGICAIVCGDGTCEGHENECNCPDDCPGDCPHLVVCGDGICEGPESPCSCLDDCPGICAIVCGDGVCDGLENPCTCPGDCPGICADFCGNGICEGHEDVCTCPGDCPGICFVCGDGVCNGFENPCTCSDDCPGICALPSDVNAKENFGEVDKLAVLEALSEIPITTWNYIGDSESVRHIGPMAQDFYAAFALGTDERSIYPLDANGVTIAAIQSLYQQVQEKDAQIAEQEMELAAIEARLVALEEASRATGPQALHLKYVLALAAAVIAFVTGMVIGRRSARQEGER